MAENQAQAANEVATLICPETRVRAALAAIKPGFRISGQALEALDRKIKALLTDAINRADASKRQTIKEHDL